MKYFNIVILQLISFSMFANCPSGMELVNNRCVMSEQTLQTAKDASQCDALSGSAKDACYVKLTCLNKEGEDRSQCMDLVSTCENSSEFTKCMIDKRRAQQMNRKAALGSFKSGGSLFSAPSALALLVGGFAVYQISQEGTFCRAPSATLMLAASMSIVGTEVISHISYKKRVSKLEEKYVKAEITGESTDSEDSNVSEGESTQTKAFDLMLEQEELYQKALKTKKGGYLIAQSLFVASGLVAFMESINPIGGSTMLCKKTTDENGNTTTSSNFVGGKMVPYLGLFLVAVAPMLMGGMNVFSNIDKPEMIKSDQDGVDSIFKMQEAIAHARGEQYEFDQKYYDSMKKTFNSLGFNQEEKRLISHSIQMAQHLLSSPFYQMFSSEISSSKS